MKNVKKILLPLLICVICAAALVGCGPNHSSPEALSKSIVTAQIKVYKDYKIDAALALFNLTKEDKDAKKKAWDEEVKAIKELNDGKLPELEKEMKETFDSAKFVKYEKVSGTDTTEVGTVTVKTKVNGTETENPTQVKFVKVDGKWYLDPSMLSMLFGI